MKKVFKMQDLDCAHCAAKMEDGIRKIRGVQSVSMSFLTQKLTLEADEADFPAILEQAAKVCRKIEPDCRILF